MPNFKKNLNKTLSLALIFLFFISNISYGDVLRAPMNGAKRAAKLLPKAQDSQLASGQTLKKTSQERVNPDMYMADIEAVHAALPWITGERSLAGSGFTEIEISYLRASCQRILWVGEATLKQWRISGMIGDDAVDLRKEVLVAHRQKVEEFAVVHSALSRPLASGQTVSRDTISADDYGSSGTFTQVSRNRLFGLTAIPVEKRSLAQSLGLKRTEESLDVQDLNAGLLNRTGARYYLWTGRDLKYFVAKNVRRAAFMKEAADWDAEPNRYNLEVEIIREFLSATQVKFPFYVFAYIPGVLSEDAEFFDIDGKKTHATRLGNMPVLTLGYLVNEPHGVTLAKMLHEKIAFRAKQEGESRLGQHIAGLIAEHDLLVGYYVKVDEQISKVLAKKADNKDRLELVRLNIKKETILRAIDEARAFLKKAIRQSRGARGYLDNRLSIAHDYADMGTGRGAAGGSSASKQKFEGIGVVVIELEKIFANVKRPIVVSVNKITGTVSWALKEDIESPHPRELIWKAIGHISREGQNFRDPFLMTRKGSLGQMVIMPGVNRKQIEEGLIAYLESQPKTPRVIEPKWSNGVIGQGLASGQTIADGTEKNEIVEVGIPGTSWVVKLNRGQGERLTEVDFIDRSANRSISTYTIFLSKQSLKDIAERISAYFSSNGIKEKDFVKALNIVPDIDTFSNLSAIDTAL